ncbi:hypothetical protein DRN98_04325 [Methanosarcinales archaeon]|nr:MAG: hypothetical protein DRN98_04325 [Methanosarcinales archaeon]
MRICILSEAHTTEFLNWTIPTNDSRNWATVLGNCDILDYRRVSKDPDRLLAFYDLVIIELSDETYYLPKLLKAYLPNKYIIGIIEGRVEYVVRSRIDMEFLYKFCQCLKYLDMIGILVERTLPYYKLYVDKENQKKVQWLGIPYPKRWTDEVMKNVEIRRNEVTIELASAMDSRNGITNLLIFKKLKEEFPWIKGRVYIFLDREKEMIENLGIDVEFCKVMEWQDYFKHHLQSFLVLCMDDRRTWGRYALDCAASMMPYVGSYLSHCGEKVGVLTCDPFDVESALNYIRVLLKKYEKRKDDFYKQVVKKQYERLKYYDEELSRNRFFEALKSAGIIMKNV